MAKSMWETQYRLNPISHIQSQEQHTKLPQTRLFSSRDHGHTHLRHESLRLRKTRIANFASLGHQCPFFLFSFLLPSFLLSPSFLSFILNNILQYQMMLVIKGLVKISIYPVARLLMYLQSQLTYKLEINHGCKNPQC